MDAQRKEAAAEAAVMPDLKAQEAEQINSKLLTMDLVEHDVSVQDFQLARECTDRVSVDHCGWALPLFGIRRSAVSALSGRRDLQEFTDADCRVHQKSSGRFSAISIE